MTKVKTNINYAMDIVNREISSLAKGGKFAAGLSTEGYHGGYRDALNDVLLVLNGVKPNTRDFWNAWKY